MATGRRLVINERRIVYIISGCPRSGTSLTSLIFKQALGDDRFLGKAFPREDVRPAPKNEYHKHVLSKLPEKLNTREMNPDGFHEMEWTVRGIHYSIMRHKALMEAKTAPIKAVKVVSQGLYHTDPNYVSKIVYCLRNPRQVAKSQENLTGQFPRNEAPISNGKEIKKHSPEMFIKVTVQAANWIVRNPDIPILIVDFDDLQNNPKETIDKMSSFIGDGDFSKCHELVKPSLNRSKPENIEHDLWELADQIYGLVSKADWKGVLTLIKSERDQAKAQPFKAPDQITCTRMARTVSIVECKMCKEHSITRENFKKVSSKNKIKWKKEPCLRDVINKTQTIEESINANHWNTDSKGLGDTVSKVIEKVTGKKSEDCPKGCQERKALLNKLIPYKEKN